MSIPACLRNATRAHLWRCVDSVHQLNRLSGESAGRPLQALHALDAQLSQRVDHPTKDTGKRGMRNLEAFDGIA